MSAATIPQGIPGHLPSYCPGESVNTIPAVLGGQVAYYSVTAMKKDEGDIPGGPLSEIERRQLRLIARDYDRRKWFWVRVRIWAGWTAAIGSAAYAAKDVLISAIKAVMQ